MFLWLYTPKKSKKVSLNQRNPSLLSLTVEVGDMYFIYTYVCNCTVWEHEPAKRKHGTFDQMRKKNLQKRSSTSQLQRGHAANEAFGTQEEDFQFCERVFLHRYSLSFRDLHGDMQVLWLKMSKSEISFGRDSNFNFHVCFCGLKSNIIMKAYSECNEPFNRFYFSTRISWNVTIVIIWFGVLSQLSTGATDFWTREVYEPHNYASLEKVVKLECVRRYTSRTLADIYAVLQHEWGSKKKHTVPSMILWC